MIYGSSGPLSTLLAGGGELVLPRGIVFASGVTPSSGTMMFTYFTAQRTETCTRVSTRTGGTAASGLTTAAVGVYSTDGTNFSLVASVSDLTMWAGTFTFYTRNWAVPFQKVAGQLYAFAVLAAGTTMPSMAGISVDGGFASNSALFSPEIAGALGGQSSLPASFVLGSTTSTGNMFEGAMLP